MIARLDAAVLILMEPDAADDGIHNPKSFSGSL